ncbi:MAG: TolC family protein [Reyranella sp.]
MHRIRYPSARLTLRVAALLSVIVTPWPVAADSPATLPALLDEALRHNPELAAARSRADAADARVRPAGALDDPMLETGIVNAPLSPLSLRREDMTMQMLGISQRLPFPGKRALRADVARSEATSLRAAAGDQRDALIRSIRTSYEELAAVDAEQSVLDAMQATLREYATVAQARYGVGATAQSDVLQAEAQLARVEQQRLDLVRRRTESESLLTQLLGRDSAEKPIVPTAQTLGPEPAPLPSLLDASEGRPRFAALEADREQARQRIALTRRDFYPDMDVKLSYGRRERTLDGLPRDDMISLTFGINLPIWRQQRLEPQVAEARAMLNERESMLRASRLETETELRRRHATAIQARRSVQVLDTRLLPATAAAQNAAFASYRVGRVDFLTLLETRMRLFEAQMDRIAVILAHNLALADLDYWAGRLPDGVEASP